MIPTGKNDCTVVEFKKIEDGTYGSVVKGGFFYPLHEVCETCRLPDCNESDPGCAWRKAVQSNRKGTGRRDLAPPEGWVKVFDLVKVRGVSRDFVMAEIQAGRVESCRGTNDVWLIKVEDAERLKREKGVN